MIKNDNEKIGIIGLGYVGIPLAISLSKYFKVFCYDINKLKINNLKKKKLPFKYNKKFNLKNTLFSHDHKILDKCNVFIITVPTPVNKKNKPDLSFLINASKLISLKLKKGDIVIYESTVYPGCTEEICVPLLEKNSKLKINKDFYCGYSPERINPGDKEHDIKNVVKIVSGSNNYSKQRINRIYKKIVNKTYQVSSIKIAESSKIIENTQRDLNIALMNEFSKIFNKLNLNFNEILGASSTKWNFINFKPGLVGGHCIGVDPYYLAYKAKKINIKPQIILAGRKTNDELSNWIAKKFITSTLPYNSKKKKRILIVGLTFKEEINDIRNSKVFDLINILSKRFDIDVYDPMVDKTDIIRINNFKFMNNLPKIKTKYIGIIFTVGHQKVKKIGIKKFLNFCIKKPIIFDLKNIFPNFDSSFKL